MNSEGEENKDHNKLNFGQAKQCYVQKTLLTSYLLDVRAVLGNIGQRS